MSKNNDKFPNRSGLPSLRENELKASHGQSRPAASPFRPEANHGARQISAPAPHSGPIYLYLQTEDFARNWIEGGDVPLEAARKYLAMERLGTSTPDEVHQVISDGGNANAARQLFGGRNLKLDVRLIGFRDDFGGLGDTRLTGLFSNFDENALIFCASSIAAFEIMERLKKKYCVEIADPDELQRVLDKQVGVRSDAGLCRYTEGENRSHFLKSEKDAWMKEYRMSWPIKPVVTTWVSIPKGTGRMMALA